MTDETSGHGPSPYFQGAVFLEGGVITGYVLDTGDPTAEIIVELIIDGWSTRIARAHVYDRDLALSADEALRQNPWHGFVFNLPDTLLGSQSVVEVRVANTDFIVGAPLALMGMTPLRTPQAGGIGWRNGLLFEGWVAAEARNLRVRCLIDEDVVGEIEPEGWTFVQVGTEMVARPKLHIHLPLRFADGRVHRLETITSDGDTLAGSPVDFIAFDDGLQRFLDAHADIGSERLRAQLFDELIPQSMPFAWVRPWMQRFSLSDPGHGGDRSVAVVLIGDNDIQKSLDSLQPCQSPWMLGVLPEAGSKYSFRAQDLFAFLDDIDDDVQTLIFALSGTTFEPSALRRLDAALAENPNFSLAYADMLCEAVSGELTPVAFPAFDYARLLEQGYPCFLFAMRRGEALAAAKAGADDIFRLFHFGLDRMTADLQPIHVSDFLATRPAIDVAAAAQVLCEATRDHLKARSVKARVETAHGLLFPAVHVQRAIASERIAIIIPFRHDLELLKASVDSIRSLSLRHTIELVIVDVASEGDDIKHYLDALNGRGATIVRMQGSFNKARAFNRGVDASTSRYLVMLEGGTIIPGGHWFEELLGRCADPDVAAASGLIVDADGIVREAGLVLGANFGAAEAGVGVSTSDPGYSDMLRVACSRSSLSATAMMTKRIEYRSVGGFDEQAFSRHLFAVDFSLRLRKARRRLVFTPHADAMQLLPSRQRIDEQNQASFQREITTLRLRWGSLLVDDPFYSPLLSLNGSLHTSLAWPPRNLNRAE